ncbi:MAG TPA: hydroxyacid dehydrogenase [Opitutus sp.]|nr:hydroxyacid dehydrogenase [Opitutus sp.]
MKPRCVCVMDAQFFSEVLGPDELAHLKEIVDFRGLIDGPRLLASASDYQDVELMVGSWGMPPLTAELLAHLPRLQAVFYAAGTVKFCVTDAFWERGIRITNASLANARPAAEFAFAEIILSLKRAWERLFLLREQRQFVQRDPLVKGCYGTTVGLLALGKIGRLVAEKLRTLDVNVIAYDPFVNAEEAAALGVTLCPLEEVFASADVISCHLPSTPQTQQLLRGEHFAKMIRGATFINTARGRVVCEDELIAVLKERPDLFAVLDVMDNEPPARDAALLSLPNVVLTPHIAGSVGLECRRMGRMMIDELKRHLVGEPLQGEVLREQLEMLA